MVGAVAPLVAGVLIGYLLDKSGNRFMVVCPPGQTPPTEILPISVLPPSGALPASVPAYVLEPIDDFLGEIVPYAATTTYYLTKLLDARLAAKVLLVLVNSCNDALTIQVVGHTQDAPTDTVGLVNIGGTQSLPASNGKLGFGIDLTTDWYPYLGVTVLSDGTPPTTGRVVVRAYGQRWRDLTKQV